MVSNDLFRSWGISMSQLWRTAYENTKRFYPAQIETLTKRLQKLSEKEGLACEIADCDECFIPMLLSNEQDLHGAACMLYEGVLHDYAQMKQSDLIILPSSVHETLLLEDKGLDLIELSQMVQIINEAEVEKKEQLSDHVYVYHWKENMLEDIETGKTIRPGMFGMDSYIAKMEQEMKSETF